MAKGRKSKYISYVLRFAVAAVAIWWAFRGEDMGKFKEVLFSMNLWFFGAALGLYFLSQLIFVFRWYILLYVQGIRIGYWAAVRLHFLGLFYNNCLPSSVGGDFLRAWYVTKHTDKKLEAFLSVFVDRVVGLMGIFLMAIVCLLFVPAEARSGMFDFSGANDATVEQSGFGLKEILLVILVICVFFAALFSLTRKGRNLAGRLFVLIESKGLSALKKGHSAIMIYWGKKLALTASLILTFVCQGIFIFGVWLIGREIGIEADAKYYYIFFPISWLLGTLPISVGGAGIMELWLKRTFISVCGVESGKALVLAFSQRILWLLGSLPGAIIHMAGAHLPKDIFIDYDDGMK
ncbi:MAG TPA: lysylphosphatidylglycerol synthase transmembrane domain-containing protein [Sedimentisphaerales bacterium]|nr:lysylphosphatidylglycerol synthase transmembrane domain-containing protein [Sedimentisphaerales bacterium]